MKAWGEALGESSEGFGSFAGKKKQPDFVLAGGSGDDTLSWAGGSDDRSGGDPGDGSGGSGRRQRPPTSWSDVADPAPGAGAPQPRASVEAAFDRPGHGAQSLLEYREAQNDLAERWREWRHAVIAGTLSGGEARGLLRGAVGDHTAGMTSETAVGALRGWERRQAEQLEALAKGGASGRERLLAAGNRRIALRHRDVAESGGDIAVLAPQATRLVRDVWQESRALGLSGEEIDARVRAELDRLSATAVLAAAADDPARALRTLEALKARNLINAETARPLQAALKGGQAAEAAGPAPAEAGAIPPAMAMPEPAQEPPLPGSGDDGPPADDSPGDEDPEDEDAVFGLDGDAIDAALFSDPAGWPAGEADARRRAYGGDAAPGSAVGEAGGRALAFSGPPEDVGRRLRELGERLTGYPDPSDVPPEVAEEIGLAVAGMVPGIGEAISAKEAYDAFLLARAGAEDGKLADTLLHGSDAALSAIGAVPLVGNVTRFSKSSYRIARALHRVWGKPVRLGSRLDPTPGPTGRQLRKLGNISDEQRLARLRPRNRFRGADAFSRKTPEEALSETHWPPRGPEENVYRGLAAVDMAIKDKLAGGKGIVLNAMRRSDLPKGVKSISLHWGKPGNAGKNYKGGFGLSKIIAKHGLEGVETVLEAVAKGKVSELADKNKLLINYNNSEIVLTLLKEGKKMAYKDTWVLTGFRIGDPEAFFDLSKLRGPLYFRGVGAVQR